MAVKKGSMFERTKSQKKQLALQTENSTVGISLFQDLSSADSALLGGDPHGDPHGRSQSEEELSSAAFAGQQVGGGDGVAGGGLGSEPGNQWGHGSGQEPAGDGQQQQQPGSQQGANLNVCITSAQYCCACAGAVTSLACTLHVASMCTSGMSGCAVQAAVCCAVCMRACVCISRCSAVIA